MRIIISFIILIFLKENIAAQNDQWTWMGGDSTVSHHGIYGTLGVPSVLNMPGSRYSSSSWTDNNGYLWLFGGNGYSATGIIHNMDDLWKYNTTTHQWTWVNGLSDGNQYGVYGTLGVPNINNRPGSRRRSVIWKDNNGNLWLFGGLGLSSSSIGILNDLWKYDISTNMWTWRAGKTWTYEPEHYGTKGVGAASNDPGARTSSMMWTDPSGNLWFMGGMDGAGQYQNDIWKFDISTGYWIWMAGNQNTTVATGHYGTKGVEDPANIPWPRADGLAWCDNAGNCYLFGGWGDASATTTGLFNDLWKFNMVNGNWTWIGGDSVANKPGVYGTQGVPSVNNIPGARVFLTGWMTANNELWLMGGQGYTTGPTLDLFNNDLWKYNTSSGEWTWVKGLQTGMAPPTFGSLGVSSAANTPGGRYSSVSWTTPDHKLWLFGGQAISTNANIDVNELWMFDPILCATANISTQPVNSAICSGTNTSFSITATNAGTYQWQENAGAGWNNLTNNAIYSGVQTNTLTITSPTTGMNNYLYRCVLNNTCGNINSTTATLSVSANGGSPSITITSSSNSICDGTNVTFTASIVNGGNIPVYQWKKNGINTGTNSNMFSLTSLVNGDVISCDLTSDLTCLTSQNASSNSIPMTVNASQTATVSIAPSSNNICTGTAVTFTALSVNGGSTPVYQWLKNGGNVGTNSVSYIDNSLANGDIIKCEMTSNITCVATPTVTSNQIAMVVNASEPPVSLGPDKSICAGTSKVISTQQAYATYLWQDGSTAPTYTARQVGNYRVTVTDNCGRISSDDINILVVPVPSNFLPNDSTICASTSLNVKTRQPFANYLWNTGSTSPLIITNGPGIYWLDATDNNGCKGRDTIIVSTRQCTRGLFVPSAFCPNANSINKYLRPLFLGTVMQCHFVVYNRYGQIVFESVDPTAGWDGFFKGQAQPQGSYIWYCRYKIDNLEVADEQGSVILIR